jgi:RHS repeat-associated protein
LTDSKGKVVQTYDYDSFSNMKHKGQKVKQPYTFTGREWDKETGLYYYRARYYDAQIGRFISFDPIMHPTRAPPSHYGYVPSLTSSLTLLPFILLLENPQILNPYIQTLNDPINYTDPYGLQIRPTIPGYWKYLRWLSPRLFCNLLKQEVEYAEKTNKEFEELYKNKKTCPTEPPYRIDPEAYKYLNWCRTFGYIP